MSGGFSRVVLFTAGSGLSQFKSRAITFQQSGHSGMQAQSIKGSIVSGNVSLGSLEELQSCNLS